MNELEACKSGQSSKRKRLNGGEQCLIVAFHHIIGSCGWGFSAP
jgi:hypothetical protein